MTVKAGIFNPGKNKTSGATGRRKPHAINDYQAGNDYVLCNCGFEGSADEYTAHSLANKTNGMHKRGLEHLKGIAAARFDYPSQGVVTFGSDFE